LAQNLLLEAVEVEVELHEGLLLGLEVVHLTPAGLV
jgi:hypothetical protein